MSLRFALRFVYFLYNLPLLECIPLDVPNPSYPIIKIPISYVVIIVKSGGLNDLLL